MSRPAPKSPAAHVNAVVYPWMVAAVASAGQPHGYCVECSTGLEPWEGQTGAREYRFAAREVGEALASVAKGTSYRAAAEIARQRAGRVPPPRPGKRRAQSNEGQLVANWI
jgi:hypothetical protein